MSGAFTSFRRFLLFFAALQAIFFLAGCGAKTPWSGETLPTKLYIDAPRNFVVEFPGNWARFVDPDQPFVPSADVVGWESPEQRSTEAAARMAVASLHRGMEREVAIKSILAELPDLTIEKHGEERINKLRAPTLLGATAQRRYYIILVGEPLISHVLVYSALSEDFDRYRPQFKEMVTSFETLR
ncbi:hypothetical protein SAMN05660860_00629 [Geoalkalibacter ferrihydriticus]|uniref:PsbP C-terminal domain-containing protein n=2 Tax=Geoalkalibacter ferrihydriticus TaxID=392333 RepID=A0A0C2HW06_9BACT|nr:hypothetical protein [Geoalkalibacter ferrihydriticus]KIH76932.1 hypothetical protein GFER_07550 [Geoalkalibacter ferrihydriticus DSM 17813]SDL43842.1 hypothetical protein SAMN05660860_00629 [Geoalkalibacter ferrihydriticus]